MKYRINISQNSNFLEIAKADNAFREDSNKLLITILIFSIFSLPFILYFIREREFSIGLGGFTIVFGFFISMLIKNYRKLKLERAKGLVIRFNKTDSSFVINGSQNYTFQEIRRIIIEYHYNDGNMILSYSLYLKLDDGDKIIIDESNCKEEIFSLAAEISIFTKKLIVRIDKK